MGMKRLVMGVIALLAAGAAVITPVLPASAAEQVPVHVLEESDVPADHRMFILDTTKTRLADVNFDKDWLKTTDGGGNIQYWPESLGASLTIPDVGSWPDSNGVAHTVSATVSLSGWNGGYAGDWHDGRFWLFSEQRSSQIPARIRSSLGGVDAAKRSGNTWTVRFTYADGTPLPSDFKGVTGFNDLDGDTASPSTLFEGVELESGFDGAYMKRGAELAAYGTNGWAGVKRDAGDESDFDGPVQILHRLAATWTGDTFTFGYNLAPSYKGNAKMTFGAPVTQLYPLAYDGNGAQQGVTPQQKQ